MKYSREEVLRALKLCAADDFKQCVAQKCPYLGGDADGNVCIHNLIADVAEIVELTDAPFLDPFRLTRIREEKL